MSYSLIASVERKQKKNVPETAANPITIDSLPPKVFHISSARSDVMRKINKKPRNKRSGDKEDEKSKNVSGPRKIKDV